MTIVKKDAKVSCDQWLIISSVRLTSDKIVLGGWGGECMHTGTRSVGLTRFLIFTLGVCVEFVTGVLLLDVYSVCSYITSRWKYSTLIHRLVGS